MRARRFPWLGLFLLPLFLGGVLQPPAWAGDDERKAKERDRRPARTAPEEKRRRAILRGLAQGIEALQALGRHEEAEHLRRIHDDVKRAPARKPDRERAERKRVEGWIELMGYAVKVLVKAGKHDRAHVVEHGKHALELRLAGKRDEKAMHVQRTAPSRAKQAEGLLLAAELLHDRGDERHARLMAELGRRWQKQHREGKRGPERKEREHREGPDLEELETRVRIMVAALPALREGERRRAAEVLERGIRTGRVLLAEREDDEAREILEQTPPLGALAEVLHLASDLWQEFGNAERARLVVGLAHYYARRDRAEREEDEEEAEHEHDDDADDDDDDEDEDRAEHHRRAERAEALRRLHAEMVEMRRMLEHLQRRLQELKRDR